MDEGSVEDGCSDHGNESNDKDSNNNNSSKEENNASTDSNSNENDEPNKVMSVAEASKHELVTDNTVNEVLKDEKGKDVAECSDNHNSATEEGREGTVVECSDDAHSVPANGPPDVLEEVTSNGKSEDSESKRLLQRIAQLESQCEALQMEKEKHVEQTKLQQQVNDNKIKQLRKECELAVKNKESMVMKYALREKDLLVAQKQKEEGEKRSKAAIKERDDMESRLKTAINEKAKTQMVSDSRLQDISVAKAETDKYREESKIQEAKALLSSSKLKNEVEAHAATRQSLNEALNHLKETRKEVEATRTEYSQFLEKIRVEQKEQSARLIIDAAASSQLEATNTELKELREGNENLKTQLDTLHETNKSLEQTNSELNEVLNDQKDQIMALMSDVADLESLRHTLKELRDEKRINEIQMEETETECEEIKKDMEACKAKEAELLSFTNKLTERNAQVQSDHDELLVRVQDFDQIEKGLVGKIEMLESDNERLRLEVKTKEQEVDMMVQKVAQESKKVEYLETLRNDLGNEIQLLKKRNATSLKELTRELKKKNNSNSSHEGLTTHNLMTSGDSSRLSPSTRTSSNHSLNQPEEGNSFNNNSLQRSTVPNPPVIEGGLMPEPSVLVEKIVKLQRNLARKQEKIDFLEEHVATLLEELKNKARIIQTYFFADNRLDSTTTMSPLHDSSEDHKRRLSESRGLLSSLQPSWMSSESGMTLELSMEINRKLQALLEDALLKNCTLKDNINTLGSEIASMRLDSNSVVANNNSYTCSAAKDSLQQGEI